MRIGSEKQHKSQRLIRDDWDVGNFGPNFCTLHTAPFFKRRTSYTYQTSRIECRQTSWQWYKIKVVFASRTAHFLKKIRTFDNHRWWVLQEKERHPAGRNLVSHSSHLSPMTSETLEIADLGIPFSYSFWFVDSPQKVSPFQHAEQSLHCFLLLSHESTEHLGSWMPISDN